MLNLMSLALFLPLTLGQSYLGKTVDDVIKDLGPHGTVNQWEPGIDAYSFKEGDLRLSVVPFHGKIERVRLASQQPLDEAVAKILAECREEHEWEEAEQVSALERWDIHPRARFKSCRKFVRSDGKVTLYHYTTEGYRTYHYVCIFSDRYMMEQARAIPPYSEETSDEIHYRNQQARLTCSYHASSKAVLTEFMEVWLAQSRPLDRKANRMPDVVEAAYQVFENFYDPTNLKKAGFTSEPDLYEDSKYLIVQNAFDIHVRKNFERDEEEHEYVHRPILSLTLKEMKPHVQIEGRKALFMTDGYKRILEEFLGNEQTEACHPDIMSTAQAEGESARREAFLDHFVKILHGHWSGWHLESHPCVSSIDFNEDLTRAEVHYRVEYQGGDAIYTKEGGKWILKKSQLNWIE